MKKTFTVAWITCCYFLSSCDSVEMTLNQDHDPVVVGVSDTKKPKAQSILWLNNEPIAWLSPQPTFPRYSTWFPLKKGLNTLEVKPLERKGDVPFVGTDHKIFASKGDAFLETLQTSAEDGGVGIEFELDRDYPFPSGAARGQVTAAAMKKCRRVSIEILSHLAQKDANSLRAMFVEHDGSDVLELLAYEPHMEAKAKALRIIQNQAEIEVAHGAAMILIFPNVTDSLTTIPAPSQTLGCWKYDKMNLFIDRFLYVIDSEGDIFLRTELATWLKLKR